MYYLSIQCPSGQTIKRILTNNECKNINGFGLEWIINAYKQVYDLDISDYKLGEYVNGQDFFTLKIRPSDLSIIRSNILTSLGL